MNSNDMELWQKACAYLQGVLNADVFARWIETIRPVAIQNNCFVLNVDNDFYQDWLEENYKELVLEALAVVGAPTGLTVRFEVLAPAAPKVETRAEPPPAPKKPRVKIGKLLANPLNPAFTFEHFVTGPSNYLTHITAMKVSLAPGQAHNPLFIYGQTGIGKTHLMQAIGHQIIHSLGMSVCYVSSETYVNEYVEALQKGALQKGALTDFRNRYRRADVLLVDDIQFFCGKSGSQEEFFHTFDVLHNNYKQIIMTSDVPPQSLKNLAPRLISRFEWGVATEIESPDFETRLAILRHKNSQASVQLHDDALAFIAQNIKSNVRSLEGALTRIRIFVSHHKDPAISTDTLRTILKDQLNEERKNDITGEEIIQAVIGRFDVRKTDMSCKKRTRTIVTPRQVAMFLCRTLTQLSSTEIGHLFDRTHATVLHDCDIIHGRLQVEKDLLEIVRQLVRELGRDPSSIKL